MSSPFPALLGISYFFGAMLWAVWLGGLSGAVGWRLRRRWTEVLTTPLAAWSLMALGVSGWLRRRRGQPVHWKGRAYPIPR